MTAAAEETAAAEVARKGSDIDSEVEAIQAPGPGNKSTNSTSKHAGKRNNSQKKTESKIKKGQQAERKEKNREDEEASGIPAPHFVHHLPVYPLIVEAASKMSHEKAFKFGSVHVGEPSDPTKGSTCVYLMPDFKIPDMDEFRKDEVLFFCVSRT